VTAFRYSAADAAGKEQTGVLEADSARAARQLLRGRDLVPLQVEPVLDESAQGGRGFGRRLVGLAAGLQVRLQALQQATEKIGKLDRAAIINELDTGSFNTIVGPLSFMDNIRVGGFFVGQWQDGDFVGVGPAQPGAKAIRFPKPNWRA
jgi:hypothetical protein